MNMREDLTFLCVPVSLTGLVPFNSSFSEIFTRFETPRLTYFLLFVCIPLHKLRKSVCYRTYRHGKNLAGAG
jgi:hypothetical protein